MSQVGVLRLGDGTRIFVETDTDASGLADAFVDKSDPLLPPGAEANSLRDDVTIGIKLLREQIGAIASTVQKSLKEQGPDEWTVEMNFGFKGEANPIPVILKSEVSGGIKVTATWKK